MNPFALAARIDGCQTTAIFRGRYPPASVSENRNGVRVVRIARLWPQQNLEVPASGTTAHLPDVVW